jgi:hypothetical protein
VNLRRRALAGLASIVAALSVLAALELSLRLAHLPRVEPGGWKAGPEVAAAERNQLGYRGRPIRYAQGDFVVVLVGDSQVEGEACRFDEMPERRLELHLGGGERPVRVFTLGASGYGQDQELIALREYFRYGYRADAVALWETPENDVWNNLFPTHWPADGTPKPTFRLERGMLAGPVDARGADRSGLRLVALLGSALRPSRDAAWERRLPKPYRPLERYSGPASDLWQRRWDARAGSMREENLATEKSHLAIRLTPASPRMSYGLDLTRALLGAIGDLVRARGGRFLVFYRDYPGHWTVNATASGDEVYVLNGKYYRTSNRQYVENVRTMNRGLESCFVPVSVRDWHAGSLDPHLSPAAVDQVMRDLARALAPPRPASGQN